MIKLPLASPLGPTITTERLILRPPVPEDFDGFCAFTSDPQTMQHLGGVVLARRHLRIMTSVAGAWHLYGFPHVQRHRKKLGRMDGPHRRALSARLARPRSRLGPDLTYWGKGYATEAAVAAMDYVVDELGWDSVIHTIAPDNLGSAAVAKGLGSYNQGPGQLPDPFAAEKVDIWGQTAAEWRANRLKFKA
ncbi:MAG: GNAT family N-acetyltransferase [Asticcacaulis sp.]